MNKEIKQEWVEALRSGKYTQARYCLKDFDRNSYCCLGVLCDILKNRLGIEWNEDSCSIEGEKSGLPKSVRELSGVDSCGVLPIRITRNGNDCNNLMGLNDCHQATFAEIADIIEEHL